MVPCCPHKGLPCLLGVTTVIALGVVVSIQVSLGENKMEERSKKLNQGRRNIRRSISVTTQVFHAPLLWCQGSHSLTSTQLRIKTNLTNHPVCQMVGCRPHPLISLPLLFFFFFSILSPRTKTVTSTRPGSDVSSQSRRSVGSKICHEIFA